MYPVRVDIILFGYVMIHLQRRLMNLCLYKSISRNFPKCILGFISWIIYMFCNSLHFVLDWLSYVTYDFTLFYYHLISNILLHVLFI